MPDAWRVDKEKYRDSSFNGAGAAKEGGRWNSTGVQVVYVSQHLAMAAQEKYVHLPKPVPATMKFVRFTVDFNGVKIARLEPGNYPDGWDASPPIPDSQKIGDDWFEAKETAVLAVPSALIPEETNYLLNPLHPDFKKIKIGLPEPFVFPDRVRRLTDPSS